MTASTSLYRITDNSALALLAALRQIAERNVADAQRVIAGYFRDRDALEPVSQAELTRRLRERSVTLLDVRPRDEYALGHLPGALNVRLTELTRRLRDLPRRRKIVAYCRGPYCVLSFEAVALPRRHGFKVRRFEDGFPNGGRPVCRSRRSEARAVDGAAISSPIVSPCAGGSARQ